MNRHHAVAFALALACAPAGALAEGFAGFGRPFTVQTVDEGTKVGIAGRGTMARAEGAGREVYLLSDLKAHKVYHVFPQWKAYWEQVRDAEESGDIESRLDPCEEQKKAVKENPQLTCKRAGIVTLNGRKAEKYVSRMPGDDYQVVTYFDPEIRLVVKREAGDDRDFEIRDIKVGAADGPFAVPAGYRRMSDQEYSQRLLKMGAARGRK